MNCTKPNAGCETIPDAHDTSGTGIDTPTTGSRKKRTRREIESCGKLAATVLTAVSIGNGATNAGVPSVWNDKTRARRDWLDQIVTEWEKANDTSLPVERLLYFAEKLDKCNYPETLAKLAEPWILLGPASIYKNLKYVHFFPTEEDLRTIGKSVFAQLKAEREAGYAEGKNDGFAEALDTFAEEVTFRELVSRTSHISRYALRTRALRAREIAMDESVEAMAKERRRMAQHQARTDRKIRTMLSQLCTGCHHTLSAVYPSLYRQYGGQ